MIVGDLGTQEILALVTDSGNVVAYHTRSVLETIKRGPGQFCGSSNSDILGLRPFFTHWVRQSAWGIDIHKEARMIAVSSNVPNAVQPRSSSSDSDETASVTVFAFALSCQDTSLEHGSLDSDADDEMEDADWATWGYRPDAQEPERDRNYKIVLGGVTHGHTNNVPNISFVNSPDNGEGHWLLSTDINGSMKLWQVWRGTCYRTWHFGCQESFVRPWLHREYPGWNVTTLDLNTFRHTRSQEEFIGTSRARTYYDHHDRGPSYDLSSVVTRLDSNGILHPSRPDSNHVDTSEPVDQIFNDLEDDEDDEGEHDPMEDVQSPIDARPQMPDFAHIRADHSGLREIETLRRPMEFVIEEPAVDAEDDDTRSASEDDDEMSEDEFEEATTAPPPGSRMYRHLRSKVSSIQNPHIIAPKIAMIHCSDSHVRLLSGPKANFPHVFCANILKQILPDNHHTHMQGLEFAHMDRLNMLHKLPELGVVLIATQTGRVAVCSLTRRNSDQLLGFRVDWVLPTKAQERSGRRPELCTLIGIAVAPIQGRSHYDNVPSDEDTSNFTDRAIDGVDTTFDPKVVVLGHPATPEEREQWRTGTPPLLKEEHRPWNRAPPEIPPWQAVDHSRRYTVMLTYSDLSVLTYELSRDIEEHNRA